MPFIDLSAIVGGKKSETDNVVSDPAAVVTTNTSTSPVPTTSNENSQSQTSGTTSSTVVPTNPSPVITNPPAALQPEEVDNLAKALQELSNITSQTEVASPVLPTQTPIPLNNTQNLINLDSAQQTFQSITPELNSGIKEVKGPAFDSPNIAPNQVLNLSPEPATNNEAPQLVADLSIVPPVTLPEEPILTQNTEELPNLNFSTNDKSEVSSEIISITEPSTGNIAPAMPIQPLPALSFPTTPLQQNNKNELPALEAPSLDAPTLESTKTTDTMDLNAITALNSPVRNDLEELKEQVLTIQEILSMAVKSGASDIHLSPLVKPIIRVNGSLKDLPSTVLTADKVTEMLTVLFGEKEWKKIKDLDTAYFDSNTNTRFRVNVFKQMNGLAVVLRLIPTKIPQFESLHLPAKLKEIIDVSQGLILVTGPTGSGKSTTIASLINYINQNKSEHIVTMEDPIEYVYPNAKALVDQRSIGEDTIGWQNALRAVLRQDPDIVVIGEMRDLETIKAALTVAETGHLVFATLHTNGAAQTIDRIIDVFPEGEQQQIRTQLASVLLAVASQKLVTAKAGGRRAAIELMLVNSAVKNAIREAKVFQIDNIIQTSGDIGMQSTEKALAQLVREGIVDMDVAQFNSNKPEELIRLLGSNK